ncbi:sporulation protein YabP [Caldanaerobius fijiensis DSM 17918]|uniref:Sporulation protein YabP n=1 Tax=Caldanaerobius fijiensis DSM 17918 TaxID=1121256 RepID=A0A1M4W6U3_9THEO|nr:sporulation protein YabP [Caldanaerobius fijiensis]SHE77004.1 sporulation protein YabP [Caldanaerobius fijiensis DSM 17918]
MDASHNIFIENREKAKISGVIEVMSFNEDNINLSTNLGGLIIKGKDLHINKLNLDDGELIIEGTILSLTYTSKEDMKGRGKGLLSKMFK